MTSTYAETGFEAELRASLANAQATSESVEMGRPADRRIVLVTEEEPIPRRNAVDTLEDAGFEVVEAATAVDAVVILENRLDITMVFSDIDMPHGLDGLALAAMVRDRWPPIEIVLTSGPVAPDLDRLPARCVFCPKPYRPKQVVEALRGFSAREKRSYHLVYTVDACAIRFLFSFTKLSTASGLVMTAMPGSR